MRLSLTPMRITTWVFEIKAVFRQFFWNLFSELCGMMLGHEVVALGHHSSKLS
jgi:hypothetical protein